MNFSCFIVFLDSSVETFFTEDLDLFYARVEHTGRVHWWMNGAMQTACHIDSTFFPFDWQECSIVIKSWAYDRSHVDLRNATNHVRLDGFKNDRKLNHAWDMLLGGQCCISECGIPVRQKYIVLPIPFSLLGYTFYRCPAKYCGNVKR